MSKINQIIKRLDKKHIQEELRVISEECFPEDLSILLEEYYNVGSRSEFIWKWLYYADKVAISVFGVSDKYSSEVLKITFLMNMFINLLDDASDDLSPEAFEKILLIPLGYACTPKELEKKEDEYIRFSEKVWDVLIKRIQKLPSWKTLKEVFEFDIVQLINTTKYSRLSSRNSFILNRFEYWLFLPQNMQFIITHDICLMSKEEIEREKIGKAREMVMIAQKMARIGNDLGTWEREVKNKDFSNSICAYAISVGLITPSELISQDQVQLINKLKKSQVIPLILKQWEDCYRELKSEKNVSQKKLKANLIDAIEKITLYHLAGKHLI